ncbi:MAG: LytR/AlgR family response regulator transcription factor [Gemmatimonadaceae bacterium]
MAEIRALIADDEPLARRGIRQLLAREPDVTVVGEARDGRETLRALKSLRPTLLFLDVQMPELDGFAVLRAHGPDNLPLVIFVTAHDEFAVRAFDAHAIDYVVKPLREARFAESVARARRRLESDDAVALSRHLTAFLAGLDGKPAGVAPPTRIVVPTPGGQLLLDAGEIDWIEADDYYAAIYARGKRHLIRESLASLAQRLDPTRFVRVHRGAIVRLDRVRELRAEPGGDMVAVLRDGTRVPVSRRRREQLASAIRSAAR